MGIYLKLLCIFVSLVMFASIGSGIVIISYNYGFSISSVQPKIYMETGPGYNQNSNYNSLKYFKVDAITSQYVYVETGMPIYINKTPISGQGNGQNPQPTIIDVLEIVNNTNLNGIQINIYFNTSNNKLPNGFNIFYSTQQGSSYQQVTPGTPIHLSTPNLYISFSLSNNNKDQINLYLIFSTNGVIISYTYIVYLNPKN